MKEKSQIDDMRAAIRGDLERSRQRLRPSPIVQPEQPVEQPAQPVKPEPPPDDEPRPGFFSSLFKRN